MNYQKIKNLQKIKDNFEQVSKELKNLLTTFQKINAEDETFDFAPLIEECSNDLKKYKVGAKVIKISLEKLDTKGAQYDA